jgi:hypothetical protein
MAGWAGVEEEAASAGNYGKFSELTWFNNGG